MKASIPASGVVERGFVVDEVVMIKEQETHIDPSGIRKTNKRLGIRTEGD